MAPVPQPAMISSSYDSLSASSDFPVNNFFDDEEMQDNLASPADQGFSVPGADDDGLSFMAQEGAVGGDFDVNAYVQDVNNRDLEAGDKADDAVDYAGISDDDDLPDEVAPRGGPVQQPQSLLSGIEDVATDGDLDDLFGDGPSSPVVTSHDINSTQRKPDPNEDSDLASEHDDVPTRLTIRPDIDTVEDATGAWAQQQSLLGFGRVEKVADITEKSAEEMIKEDYPNYAPDELPYFQRLFPPKNAQFLGKTPLKPPKPIRPTKVNLELDQDQKLIFNSAIIPAKRSWEDDERIVVINAHATAPQDEEESEDELDLDEPLPGGVTMQDLEIICADFDTLSGLAESEGELDDLVGKIATADAEMFDFSSSDRPAKRRRLGLTPHEIVSTHHFDMPSFDDPERMTQRIAQKVVLDLNDPHLLVEEVDPEIVRAKAQAADLEKGSKTVKDLLQERFNWSNDAEYDLLKQNHQHKIRSTLGNLSVEHSSPALRLQFPYYKVKMDIVQARKFHRPAISFRPMMTFTFEKPARLKRKHMKGKKVKELFASTKDLSLGDNSTALLLEYSEEHPMMMSQIGMGNRIMNYYRRQTKEDASRPKSDVGETVVLLPEDKSPFSIFGHIDPGETVTTLYNSMYRAPVFDQEPPSQDFMIIRSRTGMDGDQFFFRNIDNVYVVGQELPSVTVPGPHSRVVTTASKNRLKTISYRIIRRKKSQRLKVEDVTKHFPETTDMQNRQKMKEFMSFSKEHKEWEMKPGDPIPDEEQIQTLIRPEEVCLLESMQVGQQYLHDAGYNDEDDEEDEAKEADDQTLEQEMAPWKTSKNFIHATQGKAMLKLHGDGDPSGRGEAFSFMKTSMKGGFKAIGESVMHRMSEKKELGGHSYNVARQQRAYEDSIRRVWDAQKASLSSRIENSDTEIDDGVDGAEEEHSFNGYNKSNPRAENITPVASRRREDDSVTSYSRRSAGSSNHRLLKISRTLKRNNRQEKEDTVLDDPAVIKLYLRKRRQIEEASTRCVIMSFFSPNILTAAKCNRLQANRGCRDRCAWF